MTINSAVQSCSRYRQEESQSALVSNYAYMTKLNERWQMKGQLGADELPSDNFDSLEV